MDMDGFFSDENIVTLQQLTFAGITAAARMALFDADGRGNAGDQIHLRPGQLLDELPGIDIHRIQEPALAFGKEQIKGQRAFARPTQTGDNDELIARDGQGNILEIVFARAMDGDDFRFRGRCW